MSGERLVTPPVEENWDSEEEVEGVEAGGGEEQAK